MGLKTIIARLRGKKDKRRGVDRIGRSMQGINPYWRRFDAEEIAAGEHRQWVGGDWDAIGALQFEFLKEEGLLPHHKLVDIGCGALRGGKHFVRYLDPGNYFGLDVNESLIEAGKYELATEGLLGKNPSFLANEKFDLSLFGTRFDFAIAVSVFTHIYLNHILRCLAEMRKVMNPGCRFYASIFEAPGPVHLEPITHPAGGHVTTFDANPFHYAFDELKALAEPLGLETLRIGDWGHPRGQNMVCFIAGDESSA